ncbi:MAG: tetratricopeptide repeat protein [Treponema sp.]|nr:tetratricopeptide repeat protein [Treponema sp.]
MVESAENLNSQAIELAAEGHYPEAIACFKRAISMSKKNYLLWYNLGITYRDSGNLQGAAEALTQAYNLQSSDAEVFQALAHIYFLLDDIDSAFEINFEALELFPDNAHIWNNTGVLYFSQGKYDEAAEAFEVAVSIYPYYYDALYNLRDTYAELNNEAGRVECEERLKKLSNNNGNFYA